MTDTHLDNERHRRRTTAVTTDPTTAHPGAADPPPARRRTAGPPTGRSRRPAAGRATGHHPPTRRPRLLPGSAGPPGAGSAAGPGLGPPGPGGPAGRHRVPLHLGPRPVGMGQQLLLRRRTGRDQELEGLLLRLLRRLQLHHRRQAARLLVGDGDLGPALRRQRVEHPRTPGPRGGGHRRPALRHRAPLVLARGQPCWPARSWPSPRWPR